MTTAEQSKAALAIGNRQRTEAVRQREELIGKPVSAVVPALVHPTAELGAMRLSHLLTPLGRRRTGAIPKVGTKALARVFLQLVEEHPQGRQWWHPELRLRDLTETERRRLVRGLVQQAPKDWREAL